MSLGPQQRRPGGTPGWRQVAPAVLLVVVVVGSGLVTVLATSLGLLPLFGEPRLSVAGYSAASDDLTLAVRESLLIAVASTVLATVLGLAVATALLGGRRGRWLIRSLAVLTLAVPHVVGAASVGLLLSGAGLAPRLLGLESSAWPELVGGRWPLATVIELAWKESAFVALVVVAVVSRRHRELDDTAAVLGAGPWQRWGRVFVPTATPALAVSSLLVLVFSVGAYEVPWLLGRAYPEPLPVMAYRLFGSIDLGARPEAAAAASTGAAVALLVSAIALLALPSLRRTAAAAREGR